MPKKVFTSTARMTLALLQSIASQINYYAPIVILTLGLAGAACNFITFTAAQLRGNSCAFYFLSASIFELLYVPFGLIVRFSFLYLGSTLINTSRAFCKIYALLLYALPLVANYLVVLASIDRCLSSSVHARLRAFSQIKVAYRTAAAAVVTAFVSCIHVLVVYDLRPRCSSMRGASAMFDSMFVVFWLGFIPHTLMLVFGSLTFANIRRTKRRITGQPAVAAVEATGSNKQQRRDQKTQTQLIAVSDACGPDCDGDDRIHSIVDDARPSGIQFNPSFKLYDSLCVLQSCTTDS